MIRSYPQAVAVQKRRVLAGKRGYAKAVRRFCASVYASQYREKIDELPVNWMRAKREQVSA